MTSNTLSQRGVTLLELLVAIAVFYVVVFVAAPKAKRIIDTHKIAANINHINAIVRFARNHAISNYQTTKVCPSQNYSDCSGFWRNPMIVFVDTNNNNIRDEQEPLLAASDPLFQAHKLKGPRSPIKFYENGDNASPASLILCPTTNDNTLARSLYISLQGRIRLSIDHNGDGIHERTRNVNLDCSAI